MAILKNKFTKCISVILLCLLIGQASFCKSRKVVDEEVDDSYAKLTYDLGISFGSYNNLSYTEATVGLNYFLQRWLAWRNAVFGRFGSTNVYGLDTSLRAVYAADKQSSFSISAFAGPGYRIASTTQSGPFAEAGLIFHVAGISLGGGAKYLIYPNSGSLPGSDTEFFIILSGGGIL